MALAGGLAEVQRRSVPLVLSSIDHVSGHDNVAEMKVWGDIDPGYRPEWFSSSEGASRWIPFQPLTTLVLSAGDGTKTVSAKMRNASGEETSVLTAEVELVAEPHISILWTQPSRLPGTSGLYRFGWSCSHNYTAASVMLAPSMTAGHDECVEVLSYVPGVAGAHQYADIDMSALAALDLHSSQSGAKIIKVFAMVDGSWIS